MGPYLVVIVAKKDDCVATAYVYLRTVLSSQMGHDPSKIQSILYCSFIIDEASTISC